MENFAYLPTAVEKMDKITGFPVLKQWNYRILCQPLADDLPVRFAFCLFMKYIFVFDIHVGHDTS